jgi:pimeloyl-ACP methyl ester carboxylesterase
MNRELFETSVGGLRVSGRLLRANQAGTPLVVLLHGGSYTSAYFDLPGHSLLETGAANGFSVLALDRPCYGDSDPIGEGPISFAANAEILDGAVQSASDSLDSPSPGVVLVGHSIGGAIALTIAARQPAWPLLGVSVTGIGDVAPSGVAEAWNSMPPGQPVTFTSEQRRQFMYGPDWTIDPGIVAAAEVSTAPIPLEELLEVVGGWIDALPEVAAEVRVPVHYALAEFDGLWIATAETVAGFAGRFTAAPSVESTLFGASGHNIDHHQLGGALHLAQLAFALRCAQEQNRPEAS